jgi:hypothetical protein
LCGAGGVDAMDVKVRSTPGMPNTGTNASSVATPNDRINGLRFSKVRSILTLGGVAEAADQEILDRGNVIRQNVIVLNTI